MQSITKCEYCDSTGIRRSVEVKNNGILQEVSCDNCGTTSGGFSGVDFVPFAISEPQPWTQFKDTHCCPNCGCFVQTGSDKHCAFCKLPYMAPDKPEETTNESQISISEIESRLEPIYFEISNLADRLKRIAVNDIHNFNLKNISVGAGIDTGLNIKTMKLKRTCDNCRFSDEAPDRFSKTKEPDCICGYSPTTHSRGKCKVACHKHRFDGEE